MQKPQYTDDVNIEKCVNFSYPNTNEFGNYMYIVFNIHIQPSHHELIRIFQRLLKEKQDMIPSDKQTRQPDQEIYLVSLVSSANAMKGKNGAYPFLDTITHGYLLRYDQQIKGP